MKKRRGSISLKSLELLLLLEFDNEDVDILADLGVGVRVSAREEDSGEPGEGDSSEESSASVESLGDFRRRSSQDASRPCSLSGESGSRDRRFVRTRSLHLLTSVQVNCKP